MKENARQGFYNGAPIPLGYSTEEIEKRDGRTKNRLVVDPVEAETVKRIFALYHFGDGRSGPLGIKAIACWLNERGYRTAGRAMRRGNDPQDHDQPCHVVQSVFNKRSSTILRVKPEGEHITVEVPPIITREAFDAVAATLNRGIRGSWRRAS